MASHCLPPSWGPQPWSPPKPLRTVPVRREPEGRRNRTGVLQLLPAGTQTPSPGWAQPCMDASCLRTGFCLQQDEPPKMTAFVPFPICAKS